MNNKFYVFLEAARLLKEKGYNEEVDSVYETDKQNINIFGSTAKWQGRVNREDVLPRPTKAEVIDWLESKGIIIELSVTYDLCHWVFSIYMKDEGILDYADFDFDSFTTRLEAEEAAIIKALELLQI